MPIRWGIVGCGDVCEVKSGPGFAKADGSELTMVMRRDAAKAQDYAHRHGVPRWTDDADKLIHDPEVDAVYIATPVSTHCDYALAVAEAGKPCYVEKPMARSFAECQRMVDAFRAHGLPLFVGYYRRKLPRFEHVRGLILSGALGRITSLNHHLASGRHRKFEEKGMEWRLDAEHGGGGIFMDLASHALDLFDHWLGPIETVAGAAANLASGYDVEDNVALTGTFASGAMLSAAWNFASHKSFDRFEVLGTEGYVAGSIFGEDPLTIELAGGKAERVEIAHPPHVHQPLIQTIVDELGGVAGAEGCPSTGETAARTARVMDEALKAYYGDRSDAFWTRPESWPGRAAKLARHAAE